MPSFGPIQICLFKHGKSKSLNMKLNMLRVHEELSKPTFLYLSTRYKSLYIYYLYYSLKSPKRPSSIPTTKDLSQKNVDSTVHKYSKY